MVLILVLMWEHCFDLVCHLGTHLVLRLALRLEMEKALVKGVLLVCLMEMHLAGKMRFLLELDFLLELVAGLGCSS